MEQRLHENPSWPLRFLAAGDSLCNSLCLFWVRKQERGPPSPPPVVTVMRFVRGKCLFSSIRCSDPEFPPSQHSGAGERLLPRQAIVHRRCAGEGGQILFRWMPSLPGPAEQAKAALAKQEAAFETARLNLERPNRCETECSFTEGSGRCHRPSHLSAEAVWSRP